MSAKATAALAVGLLVAGGAFASPSLYVPGIALLALAAGAAAWIRLAARGARIERAPGPGTVAEGEPYPLHIRLRGGFLPPRGQLVDPLLSRPLPISPAGRGDVRPGVARAEVMLREEVSFARRGRHRLEPPRLELRDPLGLCSRRVGGRAPGEVLVLPGIEPVLPGDSGMRDGDEAIEATGDGAYAELSATPDVEVDGLRPYRKGSPASRIHWPAVARHGELIERRLVSGADGTPVVILDAERPADPGALDRAVRAAASLCAHLAGAGGCTLLSPGSPRPLRIDPRLRGWTEAHVRLALVEPGDPLSGVARPAGGGMVIWVTAEAAGGPPRSLARLGARRSFLVTPFPPAGGRAAFTVAGCHGRRLGASRRPARVRSAA